MTMIIRSIELRLHQWKEYLLQTAKRHICFYFLFMLIGIPIAMLLLLFTATSAIIMPLALLSC